MVLPAPLEWVKLLPHTASGHAGAPSFYNPFPGRLRTGRVETKKARQSFTNHPTLSTDFELILLEVFPEAI